MGNKIVITLYNETMCDNWLMLFCIKYQNIKTKSLMGNIYKHKHAVRSNIGFIIASKYYNSFTAYNFNNGVNF